MHLNIFIIYDGTHSADKIFNRLDEIIPSVASKDSCDTKNFLLSSDIVLPDETLEKLHFAMLVMPYKENKKLTDFNCIITFYNLPMKMSYFEIKRRLEERGFQFSSLSDNADLIERALEWYRPVDQY